MEKQTNRKQLLYIHNHFFNHNIYLLFIMKIVLLTTNKL